MVSFHLNEVHQRHLTPITTIWVPIDFGSNAYIQCIIYFKIDEGNKNLGHSNSLTQNALGLYMNRTVYSIGYLKVHKESKKQKKKFIETIYIYPIRTQNEYYYSSKFAPLRTKHVPHLISFFLIFSYMLCSEKFQEKKNGCNYKFF